MNKYSEMTSDELGTELDHLQTSASALATTNKHSPIATEEELQAILNDLKTTQPLSILQISSFIAMQRLLQELRVHQIKLEMQNRELREARQELEESRNRYVDLYDFAPNGYVTLDENAVIREINLTGAQMLGKERSSLIGKPFIAYVAKEHTTQFLEHIRRCQEGDEKARMELSLRGETARYLQLLSIPVHDEGQQRIFLRTALNDITERHHAEEAKHASDVLASSVLGSLSAQIAVLDSGGKIIAVNDAWTRFTLENGGNEYLDKTGVGVNYLEVCRRVEGEEEATAALRGLQSVLNGSQPHFSLEYPCHSPSQQRWFILSVNPLAKGVGGVVVSHMDITARKLLELAVREGEARSAAILDSAMDAIITTDAEQRIVQFNAAAEEMFRCSAQDAMGSSLSKFMPERYRNTHPHQVDAFGKTKTTKRRMGETTVIYGLRGDGEEFPMESSISQIEIGGQKFFTVIHRDITRRKRAEDKLRESEENFRLYIENNPAAVAMFDREMRYLAVSLRWLHDYKITEDVIGRSHYEIFPEISEQWKAIHRRCLTGAVENAEEDRFDRIDGSVSWLKWQVRPWLDSRGEIGGIIIYSEDISGRKQAQTRLIEQAALLNHAREAIAVVDATDNIVFWNRGAEKLYGWQDEEVIGQNIFLQISGETPAQREEVRRALFEKGDWSGELKQFTKDGKEIVVESSCTLVYDESGQHKSTLIINTDITEKKKLEAQFLRAQRLESIGTLASGIAHDLNNVLSPVLMAVQLLQMRMPDESCQRILDVLQQNVLRGSEMVKQVLSFARGSGGERIALNPKHLIKEVTSILHETFPKNIVVKYSLSPDLDTISGDPTQIHQVLMNLCVNARDAMQDSDGTLTIEAENKFVDEQFAGMIPDAKAGPYVVISIADTGTGIAPEVLEKIFDPFFTTKEVGRGTGLGLSTVHSIIRGHGGFVNVYSEVGKGTKFHLYFPLAETGQTVQPATQSTDFPIGHGELILVVDDEKAVREITQGTLESFGYRVVTATDGAEAIALYAKQKDEIRLVLTDMMMPYLDGPTMIRALHKINPSVEVIASSGLAESEKAREAAELGVKTFLTKPYTAQELLQSLHHALLTLA